MRLPFRFELLLLAFALAPQWGCGPGAAPGDVEDVAVARAPISDGYQDDEDAAIVSILDVEDRLLCTGTLIGANLVLTARHCVSKVSSKTVVACDQTFFEETLEPDRYRVSTKAVLPASGQGYRVSQVLTVEDSTAFCGFDMAAMVLEEPVGSSEAKPLEVRLEEPVVEGELFSAVGFGAVNDAGSDPGVRRRRDDIEVYCVGEDCPSGYIVPEVTATEFVGDDGVCLGDSGGPAIDSEGRVMGVTSRGLSECHRPAYGSTLAWADWIRDAGVVAAGAGEYPPPVWTTGSTEDPRFFAPVGEVCESDADCYSGVCSPWFGGSFCSRPCDDARPCPSGYSCGGDGVCMSDTEPADDDGCRVSAAGPASTPGTGTGAVLVVAAAVWAARRRRRHRG